MNQSSPRDLWIRVAAQARARERSLDYAAITRAAISLADRDGLDAVSMRKVASLIDSGTMSLYRHVNGKDELTELMYDSVIDELGPGVTPPGDWRAALADLARRTRALHHRHPWLSRLGPRPIPGPNAVRMMEQAMAGVAGLGIGAEAMLDLVSTTLHFTHGFVQAELAGLPAGPPADTAATGEDAWRDWMAPYLANLFGDEPYARPAGSDEAFERRLAMVLDGLAAAVHARRG